MPRPVLLIAGGSRGIGASTAKLAAARGYDVAINYVSNAKAAAEVAEAVKQAGGRAVTLPGDMAKEEDILRVFDQTTQSLGPITHFVHSAGIGGKNSRLDAASAATIRDVIDVNLFGAIICAREAVRRMSTAHGGKGGSIVIMASGGARAPAGLAGIVPYEATKGAMVTFARGLSNEVASEGIRVNSVSPGVIETEMAFPAARELAVHGPLGRMGRPEEIAATVSWLMSPDASFVTGSDVAVTGGL